MNKAIKITFKHDFGEGLLKVIDAHMYLKHETDDDRLIMAGLAEIRHKLYVRLERIQREYSMSLTPVQALSLRLFYTDFINEPTTYIGNKLLGISNQVAQKFAS